MEAFVGLQESIGCTPERYQLHNRKVSVALYGGFV